MLQKCSICRIVSAPETRHGGPPEPAPPSPPAETPPHGRWRAVGTLPLPVHSMHHINTPSCFHTNQNKLRCEVKRSYVLFTEQLEIVSLRRAAHSPLRLQHLQLVDRVSGGPSLYHCTGVDAQLLHPAVTNSVSIQDEQHFDTVGRKPCFTLFCRF